MKENKASRVLVGRDSVSLAMRRARAMESFTALRFYERKRSPAAYEALWYWMSRRFC
jgi:hypothetical protein